MMQNTQPRLKPPGTAISAIYRCSTRLSRHVAVKASSQGSNPCSSNIARALHQHKQLMEHGFTYDQASMILQISDGRSSPQRAGSLESPATAAATSASAPESPSQQDAGPLTEEEQQQQQNLKGIEDRLSFLEMELLKQSISVDAISSLACAAEPSNSSSSMHQHRHLAPSAAATAEAEPGSMQLDPEVLAIAESLLVRQGRVIPVSGSSNLGTADSTLHRQQQWQQQQMGGASTSSIWGRHYAFRQQIKAKPGRYTEQCLDPYGNPKKQPGRGKMLPNGHLPDADMVNSYDLELTRADDLVPYEPDGWSVAGTILLVYAGVLLTFFAVIAGTAEGSNVVDPDMLMMFW